MTCVTGCPSLSAATIARSRAAIASAASRTASIFSAGTNTMPVPSATTKSPGETAISSTVMGTFVPVSTIRPRAVLPTGTSIRNVARIIFDANDPIDTNQVDPHDPSKGTDPNREAFNTLDAGIPTSSVDALPAIILTPRFPVSWSGTDDPGGSGIAAFDVFVSDNGGPFTAFLVATTQTSATFTGQDGHSYAFYSVATDQVGHRQPTPAGTQASTRVGFNDPPVLAAIGDRDVDEETPLALTVTADDGNDERRAQASERAIIKIFVAQGDKGEHSVPHGQGNGDGRGHETA